MSDSKPTVALLDAMPESSRNVISQIFGGDFEVVFVEDNSPEAKIKVAGDATVLLTMFGSVDAATINAAPNAKLIQKLGIGIDKIDCVEAEKHGIRVLKAAGINADAVAELAILLTLAVGRSLMPAVEAAKTGVIAKEDLRAVSFQLMGKRVGIVGFGAIGQALARRFDGFGVEVVYHDVYRPSAEVEKETKATYVEQDELFATSDVISLHLPSTPETDKIINAGVLGKMRQGVIIINTARGSLIDEDALIAAINDGRVLGAGLDVTAEEPLSPSSPLLKMHQVVVTPHVGGAVANNFPRVIQRAYDNARAVLDGTPTVPADFVV